MKRKLKQKLQQLKAQSTALNQLKNNSVIKNTISQTSNTIFLSDSCIQTMISRYLFIDITQLILIFKNEFQADQQSYIKLAQQTRFATIMIQ